MTTSPGARTLSVIPSHFLLPDLADAFPIFFLPFVVVVVLLLSRFVFPYTILEFICCISVFVVVVIVV